MGDHVLQSQDVLGLPPLLDGTELAWSHPGAEADTAGGAEKNRSPRMATVGTRIKARVVAGPDAGRVRAMAAGSWVIGRSSSADLVLTDPGLSRRHARVTVTADAVHVADLGSSNGTFVGAIPVGPRGRLVPVGVPVTMAGTVLVLGRPPAAAEHATTAESGPRGDGTIGINRPPRVPPEREPAVVPFPAPPATSERPRLSAVVLVLPLAVSLLAAGLLRSPMYLAFGLLGPAMSLGQYATDRRRHAERAGAEQARHTADVVHARNRLGWLLEQERAVRRSECPDLAALAAACAHATAELWARRPGDADWLELSLGLGTLPARTAVRAQDGELHRPRLADVPVTVSLPGWGVLGVAAEAVSGTASAACGRRVGPWVRAAVSDLARSLAVQAVVRHGPRDLNVWVLAESQEALAEWEWLCWTPHARDPESAYLGRCACLGEGLARVVAELTQLLAAAPVTEREAAAARAGVAVTVPAKTSANPPGRAGTTAQVSNEAAGHLLFWVGANALREHPGVARLLREGPARGLYSICLADTPEALPVECQAVATVSGAGAGRHIVLTTPDAVSRARPDAATPAVACDIAGRLSSLRDLTPGAGAAIPDLVRLTDLATVADPFDPAALVARWRTDPATTRFVLGRDAAGPAEFDLKRDGPHALVGGTTGSGKSELLRALVLGLACGNRPDRLAFVLVDYKGGSAFDACTRLPHTVGLVTDLDTDTTRRALAGLTAELRSREARLREVGAEDFDEYATRVAAGTRRQDGSPLTHLPRLVIVVDEFRALVEELPDFVAGLVRLAALGRSLGLHLVLATQRPAGIVSADMRANLALRVALRVPDAVDSLDIVETPDAAAISPRRPGRAVVRTGDSLPRLIQTTHVGQARPTDAAAGIEVRLADATQLGAAVATLPLLAATAGQPGGHAFPATDACSSRADERSVRGAESERSDIHRAAEALTAAAAMIDAQSPPPPWLPPLPTDLGVAELGTYPMLYAPEPENLPNLVERSDDEEPSVAPASIGPGTGTARRCQRSIAPSLLVDDPGRQRRWAQAWLPSQGHLAVVGGARSGRSTALRSLTVAVLDAMCPATLTAYVVDASGSLTALAGYPHVGAYLRLDQNGALQRLVTALRDQTRTGREAAGPAPLLVIDGWEQLRAVLDRIDHGAAVDDMVQALRGGCTLLATGGRELLTGPLGAIVTDRLVLDLPDPTDAYLAGLDARAGRVPPGRARLSQSGMDAQVARLTPRPTSPRGETDGNHRPPGRAVAVTMDQVGSVHEVDEADAVAARAAAAGARHRGCPGPRLRVQSLPSRVHPAALPAMPIPSVLPALSAPAVIPLGLAGDGTTAALVLDGRGFVIAGPRGSGRTVTVRRIATSLSAAGRPLLLLRGPAPGWTPQDLEAILRATPDMICLVDDVDAVLGGPYEDVLMAHAECPGAGSLVVAGTLGTLATTYRGLVGVLRRSPYGLLLSPGPRGPELFGQPLPDGEPAIPGRGYLVEEHRVTAIQVAYAENRDDPAPPPASVAATPPAATIPTTAARTQ